MRRRTPHHQYGRRGGKRDSMAPYGRPGTAKVGIPACRRTPHHQYDRHGERRDSMGRKNKYYVKQFATLRSFKEVESLNVPCVVDDEALELEEEEQSEFAMKISNYANLALLGIKGD
ncbi:hypothetical protein BHM03_00041184 [Ensete ventricosum]|uniref:Uncharacterized protein n=1 Tax=Ensete ventricosum TaxID=4639 RepID=A0A445MK65_ENSVE|nr:hypothetical protein BHM03_00041184 [Ensete ventricosum]